VTNFGIDFLLEALTCNKESALRELDISVNNFENRGADFLASYLEGHHC